MANWKPLEFRLSDPDEIDAFMWMQTLGGVEYYKHRVTRRYLLLDDNGRCFRQGADGQLVVTEFVAELNRVTA